MNIMKPWLLTAVVMMPGYKLPQIDRDLDIRLRIAIGNALDAFLKERMGIHDLLISVDGSIRYTSMGDWNLALVLHDHRLDLPVLSPQKGRDLPPSTLQRDVIGCVVERAIVDLVEASYGPLRGKLRMAEAFVVPLPLRRPPLPPSDRTLREKAMMMEMEGPIRFIDPEAD